jgi:hypothetical protein
LRAYAASVFQALAHPTRIALEQASLPQALAIMKYYGRSSLNDAIRMRCETDAGLDTEAWR